MPQRVGHGGAGAGVPREGDDQFLGVVRAIAKEVAAEQGRDGAITSEQLYGEVHDRCVQALKRFDPSRVSSFAHYCFRTVKRSVIRDIIRGRFKDAGLKTNGQARPQRKHHREVIGGEQVVRHGYGGHDGGIGTEDMPEWWELLTETQKTIVKLLQAGYSMRRIAKCLGVDTDAGLRAVRLELQEVRTLLVDINAVGAPESDDDRIDREIEEARVRREAGAADRQLRIGGGTCWTTRAVG